MPPFYSHAEDSATDWEEYDILYPLLTYDRFGKQYRWQLVQLFSWSGGPTQLEHKRDRLTIFPIYFQQRSSDPSENYTAVFPFYGTIRNRLFTDQIFFVMFPIYAEGRKKDVVTRNYMYPFVHKRTGDALNGWQVFPFCGHEVKGVTTRTNGFGDVEIIGGHQSQFILWPFFADEKSSLGTENPLWQQALIPAYSFERSPSRDSTTVLWPFFSYIDDRGRKYREWEMPWPFIVKARGEGKTMDRVWPFFERGHNDTLESDFYAWPIYKYNRVNSAPLDRRRTRILFFLYDDIRNKNTETGASDHRVDFWPFYTHSREFNGNWRFQTLSLLEPFLINNKSIERDYSYLWALWRFEKNAKTGGTSQSLLWNLYRRQTTPESKSWCFLFGLFQYHADASSKQVRIFYLPFAKHTVQTAAK